MADEILPEASPVDNLPVAAGRKRRGRPRKDRGVQKPVAAAPESASDVGMEAAAPANPSGMSRKNVVALVKQVIKKHVPADPGPVGGTEKLLQAAVGRRAAAAGRRELAASTPLVTDPAVSENVHEIIAAEQQSVAAAQRIGSRRGGRFRHLLV